MSETAAKPRSKIPWHVIVRIAAKAMADPGTVAKVARGLPVRGSVYYRIVRAFQDEGVEIPSPV